MSVREHDPAIDLEHVIVHDREPHARITLNRPEKRNALSLALMESSSRRCAGSATTPR